MKISGHANRGGHGQKAQNAPKQAVVLPRDPEQGEAAEEGTGEAQTDDDISDGEHGQRLPETAEGS
jgi:hypothetical protein